MNCETEFSADSKKLSEIVSDIIETQMAYDCASVNLEYNKKGSLQDVNKLQEQLSILNKREEQIREKYAKHVFDYFTLRKPDVIRKKTGDILTWKEAFSDSFSKLDRGLKNSLVALIEEDGGQYRLK